jgi:DNA repair protein SbcD/Mre11
MAPQDFTFVHAADLHLGGRRWLRSPPPNAELDQLARCADRLAFQNLVELCLRQKARFLILAGDVIDGWCRDFSVALCLARDLEMLRGSGCECLLLLGNHDLRSRALGCLLLPQHAWVLGARGPETRVFEDVGVAIHGWSGPEVPEGEDVSARYPAPLEGHFNLGVLHTSAEGVLGHAEYAPCSRRALRHKGYDYWALGHVHERTVLCEAPHIVFSGNLQARGAREMGAKGATVVRVRTGRVESCEHRALDVLRFVTESIDGSGIERLEELDRCLAERLLWRRERAAALRLVLGGADVACLLLELAPEERAAWLGGWRARVATYGSWLDECWVEHQAGGFELCAAA